MSKEFVLLIVGPGLALTAFGFSTLNPGELGLRSGEARWSGDLRCFLWLSEDPDLDCVGDELGPGPGLIRRPLVTMLRVGLVLLLLLFCLSEKGKTARIGPDLGEAFRRGLCGGCEVIL